MFKSKKKEIQRLNAVIRENERKIKRLESLLESAEKRFECMEKRIKSTPEDCVIGEYCRACSFAKAYSMYNRHVGELELVYLCNKAGSCENFVQKE